MTYPTLLDDLQDIENRLLDSIDGGEECRGRDSAISADIDTIQRARAALVRAPAAVKLATAMRSAIACLDRDGQASAAASLNAYGRPALAEWNQGREPTTTSARSG